MPDAFVTQHCPRCERSYLGHAPTEEEALARARQLVREHLKRAQGADLDDGLHDNALALWDSTNGS